MMIHTTELEGIIQDQINSLRKTRIPQLPKFDDAAASFRDVNDCTFKTASFSCPMNTLYSEMIIISMTILEKSQIGSAINIMNNALPRIYREAISTNKIPHIGTLYTSANE